MNPHESKQEFERFLARQGQSLSTLPIDAGMEAMLEWFRDVRADGCDHTDADMLLFQWGPEANDESFEVNITRQFIFSGCEDENIWQLSLTFTFPTDSVLKLLDAGNKWCPKPHPKAVEHFLRFIRTSETFAASVEKDSWTVTLDYFNAG